MGPGADLASRTGGFAGFCDDLAVYSVGNGLPSTCQTEPPTNLGKRWLAAGQTDQLFDRIHTLASFEYGQKDPATADAMTVRLVFAGAGEGTATEEDQQAMLDFAGGLTAYGAQATDVRYILALAYLPVTSGSGSQFAPVGEVFSGQIASVTGVSPDQQWWRVIRAWMARLTTVGFGQSAAVAAHRAAGAGPRPVRLRQAGIRQRSTPR